MTSSTTGILSNTQAVIDENGRVTLKNISSGGIDFDVITDALVQAKRTPAINLEKDITENTSIVADFQTINTAAKSFETTLDSLRGTTSSFTTNVFDQRSGTVQTTTKTNAPADHSPSDAGNIVSISVDEGSATGSHTVEVIQKATAHQTRSDSISSKYDDISTLAPPLPTGTFTLNGTDINVTDSDSISDIVDKLNNANSGTTPTGITATIVSASDTEHYIVLSSDKTGTDSKIELGLVAGSEAESLAVLNGLGLTTGTGVADLALKNETTIPQNAQIDVDGLGVTIERQSNTISDVISGINLDIIKAEPNTIIELDIKPDLASVKQGIVGFVTEYNNIRDIINDQQSSQIRELDEDGELVEDADKEFGNLAFDSTFRQYSQEFTGLSAYSNFSLKEGYQSLSQMGISTDKYGMLVIDDTVLDQRLTEDVAEVENFFSFNMTSSDTNVTYIANGSNTQPNLDNDGNVIPYYLTIEGTDADGNITGASLRTGPGESDFLDGSVTINGNVLTFTDATGAESLKIIYNGGSNMSQVTDIELTPTRGIADSFYHTQADYTKSTTGQFDSKIKVMTERNKDLQENVDKIDFRIENYEKMLRAKFLKTEQAMSKSDALLKQLEQQFEAMNKSS
ncbi:MAG: flagellar filament capping protein FliD [Proteobacteria bacterium]|nr:flagellar filament capping protein FliD [Pseudomonadota bacterium]